MAERRRVLLIGWDAADWKVIHPLVDSGHMPNLSRLIERGVIGNLSTLQPMLSPMLWTSIATGKRPSKHGVLGFSEVAENGFIRPTSSFSRSTKAIWNILHQRGLTCHVVGWWPSHPVEPLRGAMISNLYHQAVASLAEPWPLARGTVHPPEMAEVIGALRVHPHELDGDMLRAFVPRAPEIDQQFDKRLGMLAKIVAEVVTVHAAATHVLHARPDWDFAAVYYDAIDHFSHGFMRYHPPQLDWVSERDFELYSQVVGGAYVFHDTMLGALLALAGDDVTVLLVSDHGFHPDTLRPRSLPNEPAGPAAEHRPLGVFLAAGPGIRRDALIPAASLLDIAPTVLSLFDLPVGRDMDGRPLTEIHESPSPPRFIDSWDDVPGDAALLDGAGEAGSEAAAAVLQQLADLGYIEPVGTDRQAAIDETIREQRWNLARSLIDGGQVPEAAAMLTDLWDRWPDEGRYGVALLQCHLDLGQVVEARETFGLLVERKRAAMASAVTALTGLVRELRAGQGLPEDGPATDIDFARLDDVAGRRYQKLLNRATVNRHTFDFLDGTILAAERRFPEALTALDRAASVQASQQPALLLKRAAILMAMRKPSDAAQAYASVLAVDPLNPAAHFGLAKTALSCGDPDLAAAEALAAIGCQQHFPRAHLLAGVSHWRAGRLREAETHLREALDQQRLFPAAHRMLAAFLERTKGDAVAAWDHRRLARESRSHLEKLRAGLRHEARHPLEVRALLGSFQPAEAAPTWKATLSECVIVVTGLPRSGTSMMMQMLEAGGLPILADDRRLADESNPRGYLEFEPAKRLLRDASWVASARGKVVKIVSPLVQQLPRDDAAAPYIVVAMRRPIAEVIASQRAMLARDGKRGTEMSDEALAAVLERQVVSTRTFLSHLDKRGSARVLDVFYHDAIADPLATAERLAEFLTAAVNTPDILRAEAAARVVDPRLHRERRSAPR